VSKAVYDVENIKIVVPQVKEVPLLCKTCQSMTVGNPGITLSIEDV
jgi:hypothetical protein